MPLHCKGLKQLTNIHATVLIVLPYVMFGSLLSQIRLSSVKFVLATERIKSCDKKLIK